MELTLTEGCWIKEQEYCFIFKKQNNSYYSKRLIIGLTLRIHFMVHVK